MIGVAMGDDDQINVINPQPQLPEAGFNVAEQMQMSGVDEQPGRAVDEVGITIVG